jgi:hypothetical protein
MAAPKNSDVAVLDWLLSREEPAVRALALRDLLALPSDSPELAAARSDAHRAPPIATILDAMDDEGWWERPGPGYSPKYRSTVWALILLAQVGAHVDEDPRIGRACSYFLDQALASGGQISYNGSPGGTIDCLQGNLCWALATLGSDDPRLGQAYEWLARSVTGEGVAPASDKKAPLRWYAYKCGPGFRCGANYGNPCAWGAIRVALALGALQARERVGARVATHSALLSSALEQTVAFLLVDNLLDAPWPSGESGDGKPNRDWWLPGFPLFYISDMLQVAEAICLLGLGRDRRLAPFLDWLEAQRDDAGRWPLQYAYGSKTWGNFGRKGQPNRWVTLRALRVLQAAGRFEVAEAVR